MDVSRKKAQITEKDRRQSATDETRIEHGSEHHSFLSVFDLFY